MSHSVLVKIFKKLVETNSLASGYIFFGQPGVGKRLFAESLGHYLEGRSFEPSPHLLQETRMVDPTEETIGIQTIREIKKYLLETPIVSRKRLVVIHRAERLTLQAENALLKISEETPPDSLMIMTVTSPEVLLETLTSRFQKIYFSSTPQKISPAEEKMSGMAKKITTASSESRKKLFKEYLDQEGSPITLVDALILYLFSQPKRNNAFILKALEVKRGLSTLNLNPRLQLEHIFS